ncbi:MAG: response regulator transcription factor [Polaromonas sp.]|nr:response regulator transcription factor [Polaromonas sp.]
MPSKLCITVVEDNESLCAVTVELLQQHGHRAVGVTSAEALSDEEANALIDVLLVDLNLPGEDGFSLVRRYRATYPGLTIIVISSRDRIEDRLACYQAGADAFIAKPTHPDELIAIIQAHARRRGDVPAGASLETGASAPSATLNLRRMMLCGPAGEAAIGHGASTLLSALALAPGRRLEHWQLIEALHEDAANYTTGALGVRLVRLRQLLRQVGFEGATIRAMRLEGYQLCVPVTVV